VADWYDPGVGGHQAGDQTRGRIYRVAPSSASSYTMPSFDFSTVEGAVQALQNPNLVVRYHAYNSLQQFGKKSVSSLESLWNSDTDPAMRARAFWSLVKMPAAKADKYIKQALKEQNPQLRMLAIRASVQLKGNTIGILNALKLDPDPQVRRECIIALHHDKSPEAAGLWASLAAQYDGKDRWYLEALGVGADGQWDAFFNAYLLAVKDPLKDVAGRDIVWRARTDKALPYLEQLAANASLPLNARLRYFRAFDFNNSPAKTAVLLNIIKSNASKDIGLDKLALSALNPAATKANAAAEAALTRVLNATYPTKDYLDLVIQYNLKAEQPRLLEMAIAKNADELGRNAAKTLLASGGTDLLWKVLNGQNAERSMGLLSALAKIGNTASVDILQTVALSKEYPETLKKFAAARIGYSGEGEKRVLKILKNNQVPSELIADVVSSVSNSWRESVRKEARQYLPKAAVVENEVRVPTMDELNALKAVAANGKVVFASNCAVCHKVNNEGYDFGPKLTEIGSKYAKDGMLKAIVYPSEGISFGYEGWVLKMNDGSETMGIISSKTKTDIELKMPGGIVQKIKLSSVKSMEQMKTSMMSAGLHTAMSQQEMADLLAYLDGLKRK
jgi:putative heme-binding domain-containing protein